jgi:leucyl aminopeptidase
MPTPVQSTFVRLLAEGAALPAGAAVAAADFSGKKEQLAVDFHVKSGVRNVLAGLGKAPTHTNIQPAIHSAMSVLKKTGTTKAHLIVPKAVTPLTNSTMNFFGPKSVMLDKAQLQRQCVTWALTSLYEDERYKSHKKIKPTELTFGHSEDKHFDTQVVRDGAIIAESVCEARDLGNMRPDLCSPKYFADRASKLCRITSKAKNKIALRHCLDAADMKKIGLNLHLAVGQGSERPPRLVVLEYHGNPDQEWSTALVGKGITMDTGGLNIKSFGSMETMHMDMMGAAAVYGATAAIARLQLPVNVVSVFALAENAVDAKSVLPSSIVTSLKGSTVEITNIDAEGRLVLADAMTFVQDHAKLRTRVAFMIDVATLTGACVTALGNTRAGVFSNNYGMVDTLVMAGEETLEPVWPLPIGDDHEKKMKGLLSDLINCSSDRYAGACTAAAFLKHFVNPDVQWAHLDIAGPGMGTKATTTHPAGAPGYGVQLLVRYFEKLAQR